MALASLASGLDRALRGLEKERRAMVRLQSELCAFGAVGPASGGPGEAEKGRFLAKWLRGNGFPAAKDYPAKDPRAKGGKRPNLVVTVPGREKRKLWVLSHLDVVPPGDRAAWKSDPFKAVVRGGKLFGRGVEDNQQGMVASLFGAKALLDAGIEPRATVCLAFVADEETGSEFGVKHLLRRHRALFSPDDLILVPDGGDPSGAKIEVAEKGMLWLKVTMLGKQVHASMPHTGANAMRAGSDLVVRLGALRREYPDEDALFDPPASTFEPTKREANVPNVNTIPGQDVFYLDSRVLPRFRLDDVVRRVESIAAVVAKEHGVQVRVETTHREDPAPPTPRDAPVVRALGASIKAVYGLDAVPYGMGGGTVAALFRRAGLPAAVWGKMDETAHAPNEYCVLDNLLGDSKVYAHLMGSQPR